MKRKIKALGLAAIAVFAMSAVVASAAQATEFFHSHNEHTVLTANATSNQVFAVTSSVKATCTEVSIGEATIGGTKHTEGTLGTTWTQESIEVHPTYTSNSGGKCALSPLGEAEVVTTGCNYAFPAATTTGMAPVQIECKGGNTIEIKGPGCTVKVGSQSTNGVSYTSNKPAGTNEWDINLTATAEPEFTSTGAACGLFGIPSSGKGSYTGNVTIRGYKDEGVGKAHGSQVGIWYGPTE
jgi:hypothetical protein